MKSKSSENTHFTLTPGWPLSVGGLFVVTNVNQLAVFRQEHVWYVALFVLFVMILALVVGQVKGRRGPQAPLPQAQDETGCQALEAALQRSEQRYHRLFEQAHDAVFILDLAGRHLEANQRAADLLGYSREEIQHLSTTDISGETEASAGVRQRLLEGEHVPTYERIFRKKDGSYVHAELNVELVRDENGRPLHIQSVARDITARKQDEILRIQLSNELEKIFHGAHAAIFLVEMLDDHTFKYIRNNRAHQRLTGFSLEQLRDKTPEELVGETSGQIIAGNYRRCIQATQPITYEETLNLPGGLRVWETNLTPVFSQDKNPYIVGSSIDITERKKAEEALQENKKFLQTILQTTADGFWIVDAHMNITDVNDAYCQMSGYTRAELLQRTITDLEAIGSPDETKTRMQDIIVSGSEIFETQHRRKDGRVFDVEISATYLAMNEGLFICFCRDITERKRVEQALRESHEELTVALHALKEAQEQLIQQERLASLGQLAAGIAHELNNPLASIILYAQFLQLHPVSAEMEEDIAQILTQSRRASGIVRGLLDFARQRLMQKEPIQVNDVLHNTIRFMAYELRTHNIQINLHLDPDLPLVMGDVPQLQQVFVNLLNNALQAQQDQSTGEITLISGVGKSRYLRNTQNPMNMVRIAVQDNGPGILPEAQRRIFDPFFTTKSPGQGTGLGLAVCHGIISEHNGHIWVESIAGNGATFFIELPVIPDTAVPAPVLPFPGQTSTTSLSQKQVLVIDDEKGIRQAVTRVLGNDCQVESAINGEEALGKVAVTAYDLIICDVYMPVMGGLDFYERWQQRQPAQALTTPILFIMGDTVNPYVQEKLERFGLPYLPKPFNAGDLLVLAHTLLNKGDSDSAIG